MPAKSTKEPDFEKSLDRLSKISDMLSDNEITLENALSLYEEGTALIKRCNSLIENAEKRIKLVEKSEKVLDEM